MYQYTRNTRKFYLAVIAIVVVLGIIGGICVGSALLYHGNDPELILNAELYPYSYEGELVKNWKAFTLGMLSVWFGTALVFFNLHSKMLMLEMTSEQVSIMRKE